MHTPLAHAPKHKISAKTRALYKLLLPVLSAPSMSVIEAEHARTVKAIAKSINRHRAKEIKQATKAVREAQRKEAAVLLAKLKRNHALRKEIRVYLETVLREMNRGEVRKKRARAAFLALRTKYFTHPDARIRQYAQKEFALVLAEAQQKE